MNERGCKRSLGKVGGRAKTKLMSSDTERSFFPLRNQAQKILVGSKSRPALGL